ncbi:hypothetical protein LZK96_17575, partial [Pseudomonas aeruginosa]|nr:hypothetical protein [Pseudomonas aeruginosa]
LVAGTGALPPEDSRACAEPARAKGSAYGLVSRAGRSLSPAAAVFVERVLEQDRRFAAT